MDYEAELRKVADKTMGEYEVLLAEFNHKVEEYIGLGSKDEQAKKIALKQIKGAFQAALRSKADLVEGFIIGVGQKRNKNQFVYPEALKKIDEYKTKYVSAWLNKGVEDQICNEKGEPVYGPHNTTENQKWMLKQVITEFDWEKIAWGFFRKITRDEDGKQVQTPLKFGEIRIQNPDKHFVIPGISYKFRSSYDDTKEEMTRLRTVAVTKFERTGPVDFELLKSFVEDRFKYTPFIDVYVPDENGKIQMPEGVRFYVTEVTVVAMAISDKYETDRIEFQSLHDDDVDENISLTVPKVINNAFENAVGIVIYRPFYKKANPEKGYEAQPSGEILGFLHDPAFGQAPPTEIGKLDEHDFE